MLLPIVTGQGVARPATAGIGIVGDNLGYFGAEAEAWWGAIAPGFHHRRTGRRVERAVDLYEVERRRVARQALRCLEPARVEHTGPVRLGPALPTQPDIARTQQRHGASIPNERARRGSPFCPGDWPPFQLDRRTLDSGGAAI